MKSPRSSCVAGGSGAADAAGGGRAHLTSARRAQRDISDRRAAVTSLLPADRAGGEAVPSPEGEGERRTRVHALCRGSYRSRASPGFGRPDEWRSLPGQDRCRSRCGGCGGAGLERLAAGEACQLAMRIFRATAALAGLLLPWRFLVSVWSRCQGLLGRQACWAASTAAQRSVSGPALESRPVRELCPDCLIVGRYARRRGTTGTRAPAPSAITTSGAGGSCSHSSATLTPAASRSGACPRSTGSPVPQAADPARAARRGRRSRGRVQWRASTASKPPRWRGDDWLFSRA